MRIRKYTDWKGWLEGFYDSWMDSLTGTLIALGGTNALGTIPAFKSIGLNLQQAGGIFVSVTFWSMVRYLNAHKRPTVVEENIETTFTSKDPDTGATVTQTSSKTTTMPVTTSVDIPPQSGNG